MIIRGEVYAACCGYSQYKKDSELIITKKLVNILKDKAEIILPKEFDTVFSQCTCVDNIYKIADIAVVVGGDGTVINSALPCAENDVAMLGINLGRVGFMSEVEVESLSKAADALEKGDYDIETRMMMDVEIISKTGTKKVYHALNDAVVQKADGVNLVGIELFCEDEKIIQYVSDGIIISTPTGSTGYNLSAGGPVVNPLMDLFVATAICPHMLTARPVVLPSDKAITITSGCGVENMAEAVIDGKKVCEVMPGDKVVIKKSKYTAKLIKIIRRSFYDTMIEKLL